MEDLKSDDLQPQLLLCYSRIQLEDPVNKSEFHCVGSETNIKWKTAACTEIQNQNRKELRQMNFILFLENGE